MGRFIVKIPGTKSLVLDKCSIRINGLPEDPEDIKVSSIPVTIAVAGVKRVTFDGEIVQGFKSRIMPCGEYDLIVED